MILETERLILREMTQMDYLDICKILQDDDVMYAYEGSFNNDEVQEQLGKQMERYKEYGFGLQAVVLKGTHKLIGQCGLTMQNQLCKTKDAIS